MYEADLSRDDSAVGPSYFLSVFPCRISLFPVVWTTDQNISSNICEVSASLRLKTTMSYISPFQLISENAMCRDCIEAAVPDTFSYCSSAPATLFVLSIEKGTMLPLVELAL